MDELMYLASDVPFIERENPHEKYYSINEALSLGLKVSAEVLTEYPDRDEPGTVEYSDREVFYDMDTGKIIDGDHDDDFSVIVDEEAVVEGIFSRKPHRAYPDWYVLTEGRAGELIRYIREHMEHTDEVELWHISPVLSVPKPRINTKTVKLASLTPSDILRIESEDVFREPVTQYCLIIRR